MSYRSIVIIFSILLYSPICLSETSSEFYEKAMTSFESSQLDDAYIHLKNSLNKDAQHLPSKILMGKVLALSFYYDDAIVELEEALIAGADPNLVIEYLANSFLLQQRFEDILQISERGLSTRNRALLIAIKANIIFDKYIFI